MVRKKRRQYSDEFKRDAVELVTVRGYSVAEAARNLGISENLLHTWKKKLAQLQAPLTEEERMEMVRLIEENKRLRMERDILKKATAFFANEKP